jgi:uncharacterized protein
MDTDNRLEKIVSKIVQVTDPEKIFLLGTLTQRYIHENAFTDYSDAWDAASHFTLLVLTSRGSSKHEQQDIVENSCRGIAPVTAMAMRMGTFNSLCLANNLFAKRVYYSAKELYNAGRVDLHAPSFEDPAEDCTGESQRYLQCALGFLASAELHVQHREYKLAAFMLHQTFEQLCLAKLKLTMGIKPNTHNLDRLYRYIRCFSGQLIALFPRDSEDEERLFTLLKSAYIQARYASAYQVSEADAALLLLRLRLFSQCCTAHS